MLGTGASRAARWSSLFDDFAPRRLPATLATGLVLAVVNALLSVALITLIFNGELEEALPIGIGVALFGSAALGLTVALLSGFPGLYAGVQDSSAAILGLAAASIATSVVGPEGIETVLAMIAVTSVATGVTFYLIATFRLGDIVRFVPFPVIAGLLAGTGYLIVDGSLDILFDGSSLGDAMTTDALGLLWPGAAFAVVFFVASRRHWPSKAFLGLLGGAVVIFHVITQIAGIDKTAAQARGWLLGPLPDGGLWPGFVTEAMTGADWGALAGEAASLVAILLIVPVTLLLYISALEIETNSDLDTNAELRATGWANIAAGVVGGPPGYIYLSDTVVTHNLVGGRRGSAVVASLGVLAIALVGGSTLELLPQFVIGGLLFFVGLNFLYEWLWSSRRRMTPIDYTLMLGIVAVIATVGFLPGVGVGLIAAVGVFVYRYSRIDVVKHLLTGREHQSNIERHPDHADYLRREGEAILVLELQGFIFFGTANRILDGLKAHLRDTPSLQFVIFDFRLVTGVDSSAVALFERIALFAQDHELALLLTGMRASARAQFSEFSAEYARVVEEAPDLDHGMARCEDRLLESVEAQIESGRALPDRLAERLGPYLLPRTFSRGERLMTQGDPSPGIFLITTGRATVLLEQAGEKPVRLRTVREGTVLGEISLYRQEPTTATVVAEEQCEVLHLAPEAFDDLRTSDPVAAADLHFFVARTLADRVSHADRTIRALHG